MIVSLVVLLLLCHIDGVASTSLIVNLAPYDEECFLLKMLPSSKPKTPKAAGGDKIVCILDGNYEQISDHLSAEPLIVHIVQENVEQQQAETKDVMPRDRSQDKVLYKSRNSKRSSFRIPLEYGNRYWMCLQNHKSDPHKKKSKPVKPRRDAGENADDDYDESESESEDDDHIDYEDRVVGINYNIIYETENGLDPFYENEYGIDEKKDAAAVPGPVKVEKWSSEWFVKSEELRRRLKQLVQHHDYMRVRESSHRQITEKTFSDVLLWTLFEACVVVSVAIGQVMYFRRFLEKKRPMY